MVGKNLVKIWVRVKALNLSGGVYANSVKKPI